MTDVSRWLGPLLKGGLLQKEEIFTHGIRIGGLSRRNDNAGVFIGRRSVFTKRGPNDEKRTTVAREARNIDVLKRLASGPLREVLVAALQFDASDGVLVLEFKRRESSLHGLAGAGATASPGATTLIGRALAELHELKLSAVDVGLSSRIEPPPYHYPTPEDYMTFSPASEKYVVAIQSSAVLRKGIARALKGWKPTSLIHGDLRWENVLAAPSVDRARPRHRRRCTASIVDWEFMQLGDPLYDIGSYAAEALWTWLNSFPTDSIAPPSALDGARRLAALQRNLAILWRAYWAARSQRPDRSIQQRAVDWTVVRLLNRFTERVQYMSELDRPTVLALQLSENLLRDPSKGFELLWNAK